MTTSKTSGLVWLFVTSVMFLLTSSTVSAQTLSNADAQARLQTIITQLQSLQAQVGILGVQNATQNVPTPSNIQIVGTEGELLVSRGPESTTQIDFGSTEEIYSVVLRAQDSAMNIGRFDVLFSQKPWKYFDSIQLIDGEGKIISDMRLTETTAKRSESEYRIRFSNLSYAVQKGVRTDLIIRAKAKRNIKASAAEQILQVYVPKDAIRTQDSLGIISSVPSADLPGRSISLVDNRSNGIVIPSVKDSSPAGGLVQVQSNHTSKQAILVLGLKAKDSSADIQKIYVEVDTGAIPASNVVRRAELVVDGKVVKSVAVQDASTDILSIDAAKTSYVLIEAGKSYALFDKLTNVTIPKGGTKDALIRFEFYQADGTRYATGQPLNVRLREIQSKNAAGRTTVSARLLAGESKNFELATAGITPSLIRTSSSASGNNGSRAQYTIQFTVNAFGGDIFIPSGATRQLTDDAVGTGGVEYRLLNGEFNQSTGGNTSQAFSSNATLQNGTFYIPEGQTKTFTLNIALDNTGFISGFYMPQINLIRYKIGSANSEDRELSLGLQDFVTDPVSLTR